MGYFIFNLDPKGRVNIPSKFREILEKNNENTIVITRLDGCLPAFPLSEWMKIQEKVGGSSLLDSVINPDLSRFFRFFVGSAFDVQMDRQGRILIPQPLRDYAGLEREVVITGLGKRFEIWNKDRYFEEMENSDRMIKEDAQKRRELGELLRL